MKTNTVSRKGKELAKSFRLHTEALQLFMQGWAVMGASWGGGYWLIEPDGKQHKSHTPASGFIDAAKLMLATERPVVSVIMTGGVIGRYATREEKKARILADADRWHESAFKGWADTPGKERNERLAVEAQLREVAA